MVGFLEDKGEKRLMLGFTFRGREQGLGRAARERERRGGGRGWEEKGVGEGEREGEVETKLSFTSINLFVQLKSFEKLVFLE